MLTDEVDAPSGFEVKLTLPTKALAVIALATACTAERGVATQSPAPAVAMARVAPTDVPLLYVVDGVKLHRNQLPLVSDDRIFAVRVIKGREAVERYGQDASYGVVIILTKQAAAPRA
jgi:hypothetical protein